MTEERANYIDYSYPHSIDIITFSSPLPEYSEFTSLLEPFDIWIWILLSLSIIVLSFMLIYINKEEKSGIFWMILSVILKQQLNKKFIRKMINNFLIICWLLICIVLNSSYGGCIYSLITVPHEYKKESVYEISKAMKQGQKRGLAINGSTRYNLFKVQIKIRIFEKIEKICLKIMRKTKRCRNKKYRL